MLGLIQNLRFDRNRSQSRYSFKTDLENYNTSELTAVTGNQSFSNKQLSSNWLEIYRRQ
tara:strand:- start:59 stop:235 length:177 start_codon:yes stop_codon:yes gene_type:complete